MATETGVTDRVLTVPNLLSLARLGLVPVFVWLLLSDRDGPAVAVLVVSGLTDWLDGTLARRWGQVSRVGQILDPLADRLFIFSTLFGLLYREVIPWWLVALLMGRDLALFGGGLLMARRGFGPPPVHVLGKAATLTLLVAFPLLLLGQGDSDPERGALALGWALAWWGVGLYYWTGVLYVRQARVLFAGEAPGTSAPVGR